MIRRFMFVALAMFASIEIVNAADVVWNNADSNFLFLDPGNWSPTPDSPTIDPDTMDADELTDNFTLDNFDIVEVATQLTLAGDNSITIGQFTTLNNTSSGIFGDGDSSTQETISLTGQFAELNTQFLTGGIDLTIAADAVLTVRGGDLPLNNTSVNFLSETSGQINATGKETTDGNFFDGFLNKIKVDGYTAVLDANVSVVSDGNEGVIVTPLAATIFADVNRATGEVVLTNESSSIDFTSISISSPVGALQTGSYSAIANDGTDTWTISELLGTSIIEAEDPVNNGVTFGSDINLGNIWGNNPTEDLTISLDLVGGGTQGVVIRFSGTEAIEGDISGAGGIPDGVIDALDWAAFRNNLFSDFDPTTTEFDAYFLGDFDNDLDNDEFDFLIFEQLYNQANGSGSFQSLLASAVPEPSSLILMSAFLAGAVSLRRSRHVASLLIILCLTFVMTSSSQAQLIPVAFWDFEDGAGAGLATNSSASLALDGTSGFDTGVDADGLLGFGGTDPFTIIATFQLDPASTITNNAILGYSPSSGVTAGADIRLYARNDGQIRVEANSGAGSSVTLGGVDVSLGNTHQIALVAAGGEQFNDLDIYLDGTLYENPLSAGNNASIDLFGMGDTIGIGQDRPNSVNRLFDGLIDDVAIYTSALTEAELDDVFLNGITPPIAPLSLEVNRATGEVIMKNDSTVDYDLNLYKITGSLDVSEWNSLQDQDLAAFPAGDGTGNGWEEGGGSSDTELGEAYLLGDSTFTTAQTSISLGNIYDELSEAEDLIFRYRDVATGGFVPGEVNYVGVAPVGLPGDFNSDNTVDAADYTVWRDNLGGDSSALNGNGSGSATVVQADYDLWVANYGNSGGGSASAAAVPEPGTLSITLVAVLAMLAGPRKSRGY